MPSEIGQCPVSAPKQGSSSLFFRTHGVCIWTKLRKSNMCNTSMHKLVGKSVCYFWKENQICIWGDLAMNVIPQWQLPLWISLSSFPLWGREEPYLSRGFRETRGEPIWSGRALSSVPWERGDLWASGSTFMPMPADTTPGVAGAAIPSSRLWEVSAPASWAAHPFLALQSSSPCEGSKLQFKSWS